MTKPPTKDTSATTSEVQPASEAALQEGINEQSYWLIKEGMAAKLGARAEGSIHYQVLADADRQQLYIAITANESGGYFSRERVPVDQIEKCLTATPSKPFPSKTFKDAFVGKSSNNAGFMTAILRSEGLLGAAPEAETQHVIVGDLDAWKSKLLTEQGTPITLPEKGNSKTVPDAGPAPDTAKTLTLPRKKSA
ncbi:hypothetical protein [Duganella fentianensis]|uniref:hypothetical protein n=1 Tax=Duganella fentianensis TaxID=2692177 RepID=UPI0032B1203E